MDIDTAGYKVKSPQTLAWLAGIAARENGKPSSINPHSDSILYSEWARGWCSADVVLGDKVEIEDEG